MKINRGYSQRGSFLILVAFLVPLIMAMLGFVIDFGNVYWHKSVLQNCADASALGGAKAGVKGNGFDQVKADNMAEKLHDKNKRYASEIKEYDGYKSRYRKSKSDSKTHYYIVTMTEKVPMIFLRYFGCEEMEIEASCNARIPGGKSGFPLFDNLITFSKRLYVVQSDKKEFIGNIIHTEQNVETPVQGRGGLLKTPSGLIDPGNSDYHKSAYAVDLEASQNEALRTYINDLRRDTPPSHTAANQSVTADMLKNPVTYVRDIVGQVVIGKDFDQNPNNVHVLIVEDGTVNIHINSNVTCKLFIINLSSQTCTISRDYANENSPRQEVHAIIYAPNAYSVVWNPKNIDFYGSVAGRNIEIQDAGWRFTHESIDIPGEDGGSNGEITMSDDDDIKWEKNSF